MNRRYFLTAVTATPLGLGALPVREVRKALAVSGSIQVHLIVSAHSSEKSAEKYRTQWIGEPFEYLGEFYRDSTEFRELPEDVSSMPGTLTFHTATVGAAAEKRTYLVGAFRRGNIAIIVRMIGDHENTMFDIAEHLLAQQVPTTFEILWNPIHLRKFIPGRDDLGMSVEESDAYWP